MDILSNLLEGLLKGGNGASAGQIDAGGLAAQFGLSPDQMNAAVGALLPAVMNGIHKAEQQGNLGSVVDIAGAMGAPHQDIASGNDVLGQIFGSKEVSRQVAGDAAAQIGISGGVLKALLPVVAGLVAQQVATKASGTLGGGLAGSVLHALTEGGASGAASAGGGGLADVIGSLMGGAGRVSDR